MNHIHNLKTIDFSMLGTSSRSISSLVLAVLEEVYRNGIEKRLQIKQLLTIEEQRPKNIIRLIFGGVKCLINSRR